ncbi:hypothetical protein [Bradyrhizobium sp. DASA03120]|uniref:hypothetical protein n=1 Tax=Bradyrhizobium sp. SMVTL-02 TaxID=3395917 RepID=UPI003F724651
MPRKAIPADIRSLCRAYTAEAIRHLAAIMRQPEYPPAARVQAANVLLDRGWGKAVQPIAGEDGEPLRVIIRQIADAAEVNPVPTNTTAGLVNWSKPPQPHVGEGDRDIRVVIRQIGEVKKD